MGWDDVDGAWEADGKEVTWNDGNFDGACVNDGKDVGLNDFDGAYDSDGNDVKEGSTDG